MDVNREELSKYKLSKDPWVRGNYAGVLGALGIKCKNEDLDFIIKSLSELSDDANPRVRQAAINAKASIYSTRRK